MKDNNPDISISMKNTDKIEIEQLLEIIQNQLSNDKIENIVSFDLRNKSSLTSYVIIGSGTSSRHIASSAEKLADKMEETLNESLNIHMEGKNKNAQWILIDFQDIIVHLFTDEKREYYNLEALYEKK